MIAFEGRTLLVRLPLNMQSMHLASCCVVVAWHGHPHDACSERVVEALYDPDSERRVPYRRVGKCLTAAVNYLNTISTMCTLVMLGAVCM